jgi:hypothetical protein
VTRSRKNAAQFTVGVTDNTLTADPASDFLGTIAVLVRGRNGLASGATWFTVHVAE